MNPKIILATSSPFRKKAFENLDIEFTTETSDVDEHFKGRPDDPEKLVVELAKLKAQAVAKNHNQGIVIGFDSVGWFKNEILEKPKTRQIAFDRLTALSENNHQFYTGVHLINLDSNQTISDVCETQVFIRKLTAEEINKYLDQDQYYNKYALGYDPLGHYSCTFAREIKGSYNNFLRGIPLERIVEMLCKLS